MNNSRITLDVETLSEDKTLDIKPKLREREQKLLNLIEAIRAVSKTREWGTLKTELFETLVHSLERDLRTEAKKEDPDTRKLNRLSGQLKWAERYADLNKLEEVFKVELTGLRKQLYGTEQHG